MEHAYDHGNSREEIEEVEKIASSTSSISSISSKKPPTLFDRPTGGYRRLDSFTLATLVQLETWRFCRRFLNLSNDPKGRLFDQMTQAARSGRANVIEGAERAATSRETELKLLDVARASLGELLGDYEMWLLFHDRLPWTSAEASTVYKTRFDPTDFGTDFPRDSCGYILAQRTKFAAWLDDEDSCVVANTLWVLTHRAMFTLRRQMETLGKAFAQEGGFRERMTAVRVEAKRKNGEADDADAPPCPLCAQPMRLRNGKKGQFWGCSAYPDCKGARDVAR